LLHKQNTSWRVTDNHHIILFFIVVVGSVFIALLCSPPGVFIDSLKLAFSTREVSAEQAQESLKILTQLRDSVVSMVILVSILGFTYLLSKISDSSTYGPTMAMVSLSIYNGIAIVSFAQSLCYNLQRKSASSGAKVEFSPLFSDTFFALFCIFTVILQIGMLFVMILLSYH